MRKILKKWGLLSIFIGSAFSNYGQSYPDNTCPSGVLNDPGCYGTNNTFLGYDAAGNGAFGHENVFVGVQAGENNGPAGSLGQQGSFNTFLGWQAGRNNTTGQNNTSIGAGAGRANTTGIRNFYMGIESGRLITNGVDNVMIGDQTGFNIANANSASNVFIGGQAGWGFGNIATDNPINNVCIGRASGWRIGRGTGNVFVGNETGLNSAANTINCIAIGNNADITASTSNAIAIGLNSGTACSNCMSIGNGSAANNIQFRVGIGTNNPTGNFEVADMSNAAGSNDIRFPDLPSSSTNDFIVWDNANGRLSHKAFTPLSATCTTTGTVPLWNSTGQLACSIIQQAQQNNCSGSPTNAVAINGTPISCATPTGGSPTNMVFAVYGNSWASGGNWTVSDRKFKKEILPLNNSLEKVKALEAVSYIYKTEEFKEYNFNSAKTLGFIAQDVSKIIPEATAQLADGSYIMNYSVIIPVLTGAIKEQQGQIEDLKSKLAAKELREETLESKLTDLESALSSCCTSFENRKGNTATDELPVLEQNNPNPFNQKSIINYYIPTGAKKASITIYTNTGIEIKSFTNLSTGKGGVQIEGGSLTTGTYIYNLVIDGKQIDTKWMIVTK